jgi:hypothetical protein
VHSVVVAGVVRVAVLIAVRLGATSTSVTSAAAGTVVRRTVGRRLTGPESGRGAGVAVVVPGGGAWTGTAGVSAGGPVARYNPAANITARHALAPAASSGQVRGGGTGSGSVCTGRLPVRRPARSATRPRPSG